MKERIRRTCADMMFFVSAKLPERRIEIHSGSVLHSLTIGTREQFMGIASAAMIAGWLTVGTVNLVAGDAAQDRQAEAELARMSAQVQALKADTAVLKGQVLTTAERIEQRQRFLDALLTGNGRGSDLVELLPQKGKTRFSPEAAANAGVLAPFAALEQRQSALVDRAAATAETRLRDAEQLIGRLGLSPTRFVSQSFAGRARLGNSAMGGPFVAAGDSEGADPRFAELFVNWQRVEQMEDAMKAIPAFVPARTYTLTSGFGFRYDPFHGRGAQHAGIDLAGVRGEPIYAAAAGHVVRAGRFGAYGIAVDIDHGKGITTRYAHLSSLNVAAGDQVAMGEQIGGMGSTGRSTGVHLHYEIRIDGQAINPRPFLESSSYILAFKRDAVGPKLAALD